MRMRLASFLVAALGFGAPQAAIAADMPVKAPAYKAPSAVVAYSWTGCYVGGHVGGLWAHKDWTLTTPGDPFFGQSLGSHNADSWLGGVQGGCDYQFAGHFVVGVQGDYSWTDAEGSHIDNALSILTNRTRIKSLSTVTGRVGYAWQQFLGYVKGGGAWERDEYDAFVTATGAPFDAASETRSGWTVGIGGEYAFTNYLSGFVEYNYYDFGTRQLTFIDPTGAFSDHIDIKERKSVVRVGLNLRWSPMAGRN